MKARLLDIFSCCIDLQDSFGDGSSPGSSGIAENRINMQRKAIESLLHSCGREFSVIPCPKWRRKYRKWIAIGPEGAEELSEHLQKQIKAEEVQVTSHGCVPKSRVFDFHGLRIENDGIRCLVPVLSSDPTLTGLDLSSNNLTDDGIPLLLAALTKSPCTLEKFSIMDNPITEIGVRHLLDFFALSAIPLQKLSLSKGCVLNGRKVETNTETCTQQTVPPLSENVVKTFVNLLTRQYSKLTYLAYRGNGFNDFDAKSFGTVLCTAISSSTLRHLAMHDCYNSFVCDKNGLPQVSVIEPFRLVSLALSSPKTSLKILELQIPLCEAAVEALSSGISNATGLTVLNLHGCSMNAKCLSLLGAAIALNRTITSLDISCQSTEIMHPLCRSHFLSGLRDGKVKAPLSSTGRPLLPIFQSLHDNRTLQELNVMEIDIFPDDVEELCACMESSGNNVISTVVFSELNSDPLVLKLESLLLRNRNRERDLMSSHDMTRRSSFLDASFPTLEPITEEPKRSHSLSRPQPPPPPQQEQQRHKRTHKQIPNALRPRRSSRFHEAWHGVKRREWRDSNLFSAHTALPIAKGEQNGISSDVVKSERTNGSSHSHDDYASSATQGEFPLNRSPATSVMYSPRSEAGVPYLVNT